MWCHIMGRRWRIVLILSAGLVCYLFYQRLQSPDRYGHNRPKKTRSTTSPAECSHLKSLILNSVMKIFNETAFFEVVKGLRGCPWIEDQSEHDLLKTKFQKCCNASYSMIVTQENTPIGRILRYDGGNGKKNVTESLYSLFPKKSPLLKPIRRCAVVGNGGILNNSFCGAEIDRADFVFRLNLPPLNWTSDVGTKTDIVTANPSILVQKFSSLMEKRAPFVNMVKEYGSALIMLPAFSYLRNTDVSLRALYTIDDFDLKSRVVFFNPDYLKKLATYWKRIGIKFVRLSSGLMLVTAAIEVCDKVTLYGFWPFYQDLDGVPILYHYYDNALPRARFHSMPEEFYQYLQMHIRGSIRLKLEQC